MSSETVVITPEWQKFVESWMDWQEVFNAPRNYNRLASAMGGHDKYDKAWSFYIELARRAAEWYHETHSDKLLRQKDAQEVQGWKFIFDGEKWVAVSRAYPAVPGESFLTHTTVSATTLKIVLLAVTGEGVNHAS